MKQPLEIRFLGGKGVRLDAEGRCGLIRSIEGDEPSR